VTRLSPASVSGLLAQWGAGDDAALHELVPLIYPELRRLAHHYLQRERPDRTLQSAALVHEDCLRLTKQKRIQFQNRPHFIAISAQWMRQILVEYERSDRAAKRGGGWKVSLEVVPWLSEKRRMELVALDDALNGLAQLDAQQSPIVELRFFGDLSIEETAQVLGISRATVKRDWTARAWLQREMRGAAPA
jgi:RNA polymerase sigma factor (TIGR02999 family)